MAFRELKELQLKVATQGRHAAKGIKFFCEAGAELGSDGKPKGSVKCGFKFGG